ncbi:MAG TPA: hypothetical protein PLV92_13000 [Pirellulaceae bacterium]|nr:hypothetical protein [Pirellulaceae bacterium]
MYALRRIGIFSVAKLCGLIGVIGGAGTDLSLWLSGNVEQAARGHFGWSSVARWVDGQPLAFLVVLLVGYAVAGFVLGVLCAVTINVLLMLSGGVELEID